MGKIISFNTARKKAEERKCRAAFHRFHYMFNEDVIDTFWDFVGEQVQEKTFLQFFQILKEEPLISLRPKKRFFFMPVLEVETPRRKITLKYSALKGFETVKEEAKTKEVSKELNAGSSNEKPLS